MEHATGRAVEPTDPASAPILAGEIRFDDAALNSAATDFGHLVYDKPAAVVLPACVADVVAVMRWAGGQGQRVAAQGRRSSVYGRGQVRDGIALDMTGMHAIHKIDDDRVSVGAGATWREVLAACLPHGLTPPVVTEYLDLTVGGTLAVGGIGANTSRYGAQSDNVLELEVVTGSGEHLTCSPTHHSGLFDAVRAGLGQVAVVVRATMRLVPATAHVRRVQLFYSDLATMLHDQRRLLDDDRCDSVQGAIVPAEDGAWHFRIDAVTDLSTDQPADGFPFPELSDERSRARADTLPYRDYLSRLDALEQGLRAAGRWHYPHPWLTTFIGHDTVESVVTRELAALSAADLGSFGQVVLNAIPRGSISTPLLRLPADDIVYAFNFIRVPETDDTREAERLVTANRASYERIRATGGTLYPASAAIPLSAEDWRTHFGPAFDRFRSAKLTFDPNHVLNPGYNVLRQTGP